MTPTLRTLAAAFALAWPLAIKAAALDVHVQDMAGQPLAGAVVSVLPDGPVQLAQGATAQMAQKNRTFVPHVLAITTGTVVDFPNSDRIYHNVFSLSKTRPFDLGRYAVGHSKSVRFDRPGIVRVFCDIHSHMSAFILVFAHRYFAVTDADGRYRLDNVPPGQYTVVAWNDGQPRQQRPVRVPEGGAVELDFVVQ